MKKQLLLVLLLVCMSGYVHAQRFISDVFSTWTVSVDTYATNYSYLSGTPTSIPLTMDVYQPAGDTMSHRPMVIIMHTGSFLPCVINQTPEGFRQDSATVELCRRFVKKGYVVANVDYRLGWNPQGSSVDIRTGTIINAIYRAVQDGHSCIRYFHKDAATVNKYKIDSNKVIIGGHGTGGYIAINLACLTDTNQLKISKFISSTTIPAYGFVAGAPYINWGAFGDFNGYGGLSGLNNGSNSVGYGGKPQFVFTMGGCLGDSSWMTGGLMPIVGIHEPGNPFAPYGNGTVYVPGTALTVVDVSGDSTFVRKAVAVGNNNCFKQYDDTAHDPYTTRARSLSGGVEGLCPISLGYGQSSPWNWYDSASFVGLATVGFGYTVGHADTIIFNDKLSNTGMSKTKAMAYIDTAMGYLIPRIAYSCLSILDVHETPYTANDIAIYPNPVSESVTVKINAIAGRIKSIVITDLAGKTVYQSGILNVNKATIERGNLSPGVYLISVNTSDSKVVKKLILQ